MTLRQSQDKVLTIAQFARLCRVTPRTLRFYEQKGLLKPAVVDEFTKYRGYLPEQVREVLKIKLLQQFNSPLNEIKELLQTGIDEAKFLEAKEAVIKKEIVEKQA